MKNRRQRGVPENENPYSVLEGSVSYTGNNVSMVLKSDSPKWKSLSLTLSTLVDRTVRLIIDEENPIAPRYRPPRKHVIPEEPAPAKFVIFFNNRTYKLKNMLILNQTT